ncbi:hypothetical protein BROUX41_005210 [Berkeleyomyces rouxiae]|uniref:uncharacterized protein n=1 Tax=Berkeleyomyces rouxiae TaxID=2035830 RepID=UPI003B7EDED6
MRESQKNRLVRALLDMDRGTSIAVAAHKERIPAASLQRHLDLYFSRLRPRTSPATQQLTPVQEAQLTEWAIDQESVGNTASNDVLQEAAQAMLTATGNDTIIDGNWAWGFLRRNPELNAMRDRIDAAAICIRPGDSPSQQTVHSLQDFAFTLLQMMRDSSHAPTRYFSSRTFAEDKELAFKRAKLSIRCRKVALLYGRTEEASSRENGPAEPHTTSDELISTEDM